MQRGAGEPHIRADMRIRFRTVRMLESAHEAQLLAERKERFCGLAELKVRTAALRREPTPFIDAVLGFGQRHAVGRVNGTEAPGNPVSDFGSHGVENREGK